MAVRQVTRKYADLKEFIGEYRGTLARGGIFLAKQWIDGEPAKEIKLDLDVPGLGRLGPIPAQMVHAEPGKGWGFRLIDVPPEVQTVLDQLIATFDATREYLVDGGRLVPADQAQAAAAAPVTATVPFHTGERGYRIPILAGAPALTGELSDASFRDAIIQMALMRATGVLEVRQKGGIVRHGFWKDGGPVGWRTDPVQDDETLGMLLYRSHQVKREQFEASLELMRNSPLRQGEAFMMIGVLGFSEVLAALGKQIEIVLQNVMQEKSGGWAFYPLPGLTERFIVSPLKIVPRIYRALIDAGNEMDPKEFKTLSERNDARFVVLRDEVVEQRKEFEFSDDEQKVLEVLATQPMRSRDLVSRTSLGRKGTAVMLWALEDLGVLEFRDEEGAGEAIERMKRRIEDKKAQIAKGNPFDVIGVHWTATADEVKLAYKKVVEDFSPEIKGIGKQMRADLETVQKALEAAYVELRSDERRRGHRMQVVDAARIASSAELLARKGEMALERKDGRGAMICFLKASELIPKDDRFLSGIQRAKKLFR